MTVAAAVVYGLGAFAVGYCIGLFVQALRKFGEQV